MVAVIAAALIDQMGSCRPLDSHLRTFGCPEGRKLVAVVAAESGTQLIAPGIEAQVVPSSVGSAQSIRKNQ